MGMMDDTWRPLAGLFSVGMVLVTAIVLGYLGGNWLDGKFGTRPWFMVVGVGLGTAAGFVALFRTVKKSTQ
jgi:F0F1-type ATP synthase assembly protein I